MKHSKRDDITRRRFLKRSGSASIGSVALSQAAVQVVRGSEGEGGQGPEPGITAERPFLMINKVGGGRQITLTADTTGYTNPSVSWAYEDGPDDATASLVFADQNPSRLKGTHKSKDTSDKVKITVTVSGTDACGNAISNSKSIEFLVREVYLTRRDESGTKSGGPVDANGWPTKRKTSTNPVAYDFDGHGGINQAANNPNKKYMYAKICAYDVLDHLDTDPASNDLYKDLTAGESTSDVTPAGVNIKVSDHTIESVTGHKSTFADVLYWQKEGQDDDPPPGEVNFTQHFFIDNLRVHKAVHDFKKSGITLGPLENPST